MVHIKSNKNKNQIVPRRYQLELLQYVTQRNGIIYLPTGAGKTYVAIMALKHFTNDTILPIELGGKRAIFMCNTVQLAAQQAAEIRNLTSFSVGYYVGDRDVDNWSREKWDVEINNHQILVGTVQIFLNLLQQNYITVNDFSCVVCDECHHATKNHPMHEFMRFFTYADQTTLPRVIGLTGVLLKGNKLTNIKEDLKTLEATFRGNIVTVSSLEQFNNVMVHSTHPYEELLLYKSEKYELVEVDHIRANIDEFCKVVDGWDIGQLSSKLTKNLSCLREPSKKNFIKNILKDFVHQMEDFGMYAASIAIMSPLIEFEIRRRQTETLAMRNLFRTSITYCENIRHIIAKRLLNMTKEEGFVKETKFHDIETILNFSNLKLLKLLFELKDRFTGKKAADICCLVFVERRYSAKCLYYLITKFFSVKPKLKDIVRADFMIGRNSIGPSVETVLERNWNNTAIKKFRTGECNVIICSNVLEEGIDIQACNYVFTVDPLKTFNSYIQTKGRARSFDSFYGVIAPLCDRKKIALQIKKYRDAHEEIKSFLIGRVLDREDPNQDEIAEQFTDDFEPFVIKSGARLMASSALNILHRYCQSLPSDVYGIPGPSFSIAARTEENDFVIALQLPIQSTVKETVMSEPMPTARKGKVAVAFKACQLLYERGELNERLLPVTKRECVAQISEEFFKHWQKHNDDVTAKIPGKTVRRYYNKLCPEELCDAMPRVGETCYAYEIHMEPRFGEENIYNEHYIKMLNTPTNYAMLLRKKLPQLAEMPLFMNQGRLAVKVSYRPYKCVIKSAEDLEKLTKFHLMIFRDILECCHKFYVIDRRNQGYSYLYVPLKNGGIDWELVNNFQKIEPSREYSTAERATVVYKPEDFEGKVVTRWYSSAECERFLVIKVCTDMNIRSPFNSFEFETYQDFYEFKYKSRFDQIMHPDQFLIQVKEFTKRRNFFINAQSKTAVQNKNRSPIYLLPELCHNFRFPGDMWLKALLLPSCGHRINYLLHADQLRRRINSYLNVKLTSDKKYCPKPIIIDTSLKRLVDYDGNIEEKTDEVKSVFSLPPENNEMFYSTVDELYSTDICWKKWSKPIEISPESQNNYPIELYYYYKFISGTTENTSRKIQDPELEWSESEMANPAVYNDAIKFVSKFSGTADRTKETKCRIEILEYDHNAVNTVEQRDILAAITTAECSDIFNMERFELLGDSFLKLSVSLFLISKYPKWHEGFLTEVKSKLVSNRNLMYCMLDLDIPQRICATSFRTVTEWVPPMLSLPGNLLEAYEKMKLDLKTYWPHAIYDLELTPSEIERGHCSIEKLNSCVKQTFNKKKVDTRDSVHDDTHLYLQQMDIADKTIADTLEALLGVCVRFYGIRRTFRMLEFFGILKPDPKKPIENLLYFTKISPLLRPDISSADVDGFLTNYALLEENLGYRFRDRAFLLQALTHPSYPTNRLTGCYQELEFVGDAILDFLISCFIFERFQNMAPGKLTDLRSALVNNITLGCVCVRHRFHLFLLAENGALTESINNFVEYQKSQSYHVTDQIRILLEETTEIVVTEEENLNDSSNSKSSSQDQNEEIEYLKRKYNFSINVDVPKALGDVVESLIAAVFFDSGDLSVTWKVIFGLLEQELDDFSADVPIDAVRQLTEHKHARPQFSAAVVDDKKCLVKCAFLCNGKCTEVNGFGTNGKQAKKSAAKHALQILSKYDHVQQS